MRSMLVALALLFTLGGPALAATDPKLIGDWDGAIQAGFNGYLSRRAGDLRTSRRGFKAVLRCTPEDREIIVVSIGGPLK